MRPKHKVRGSSPRVVTNDDRELASLAMVKGYHDCALKWQSGPGATCDCDGYRIDGCKARVEAIAEAISKARYTES